MITANKRYNKDITHALQSGLKRLGLEYQKIVGVWNGDYNKSFLVWNTAYTREHFRQVIFKLNELFKHRTIYLGHSACEEDGKTKYEINMWETKSLDNIHYEITKTFTSHTICNTLKDFGTILTRNVFDNKGNLVPRKIKDYVKFEELQQNICLASSKCLMGAYKREQLIKSLLKSTNILDML